MLYLKRPTEQPGDGGQQRVPIAEPTALRLERALLCDDATTRSQELREAFADDQEIAGWAMRVAEHRLGRTVNRFDEAADWLCGELEGELAATLVCEPALAPPGSVEWRLTALASRLGAYEQKLSSFYERLEREKLESLKELAYGAGHEINNPLANIAARAQTLLVDEADPERQRKLAAIHRQAMRAHEMIADLMLFARPPKLKLEPCDVGALITRIVDELRDLAAESSVDLAHESRSEPIQIAADATQLGVAIRALVVNALEALGEGGNIRVRAEQIESGGEQLAQITVADDGPGISDDVRQHLFDPFFSGREAGRGLGFGLSKCWRIVSEHGGRVIVQRPAGGGAEFSILLPLEAGAGMSL